MESLGHDELDRINQRAESTRHLAGSVAFAQVFAPMVLAAVGLVLLTVTQDHDTNLIGLTLMLVAGCLTIASFIVLALDRAHSKRGEAR